MARTALLLLALASTTRAEETLESLVAALNRGGSTSKLARARLLSKKDPRTAALVEQALPNFFPKSQRLAIALLRDLPEEQSRPALRRLLQAKASHVRLCAALAMYGTNEGGLIEVMTTALDAPDQTEFDLTSMARALLELDAFALKGPAAALVRPERDEAFLLRFFSTTEVRDSSAAVGVATTIAEQDKRPGARAVAAAYLIRHGNGDFASVLGKALGEAGIDKKRFLAVRAVLTGESSELAANVIAKAARKQPDGETVAAMLWFLRLAKYPKVRALSEKMIEHPSDDAAMTAFRILAAERVRPMEDALKRIVAKGPDAAAIEAARLLMIADDASGFERVLGYVKSGKTPRIAAIGVLAMYRRSDVVEPFLDALEDEEHVVRTAAVSGLVAVFGTLFPYRVFRFENSGYETGGTAEARQAAVAKIRAWWEKNKDADW